MLYALSWVGVFSLLALWSLTAWAFHSISVWTVSNVGVLAGDATASEGLRMPAWLAPWVPPEFGHALDSMVSAMVPAIQAVLGWAPALAGGVSVVVWVVWAIGSVLLIGLGFLITGLIAVLRRRVTVPFTPTRSATTMR